MFFGDGSSRTLQKTVYKKKIVSKSFYKKFDQKSKTDFLSKFFHSRFWTFLGEGSSKKILKKSDPGPFLASEPPTHHGGHRFCFIGGPLTADLKSMPKSY
jgi:hypothetical protein